MRTLLRRLGVFRVGVGLVLILLPLFGVWADHAMAGEPTTTTTEPPTTTTTEPPTTTTTEPPTTTTTAPPPPASLIVFDSEGEDGALLAILVSVAAGAVFAYALIGSRP